MVESAFGFEALICGSPWVKGIPILLQFFVDSLHLHYLEALWDGDTSKTLENLDAQGK